MESVPEAAPAEQESLRTVIVALVANAGIAAAKFIAALVTRSSSMLAEAFHATADTGNQVLLLLADRRARRPADDRHPFGYGREAYFWALTAALGMFFTGSLLAVRQGVEELVHPIHLASPGAAYVVLAIAFCLDGMSLARAYRQLKREAAALELEFLEHFDRTSDPVGRAVFAEDAVGMIGDVVAFAGVLLGQLTGSPIPDAVGALVIGVCLAVVAIDLTRRNRDFLVGRLASPAIHDGLRRTIVREAGVVGVQDLWITFVGPRRLWVLARIALDDALDGRAQKRLLRTIENAIRRQSASFARVDLIPC
jgi:cation diffusion facilitator family transporter